MSLVAWCTIWSIVLGFIFLGGFRQLEIYLMDEERAERRKAIREAMIERIKEINFIHPHERVSWDDLFNEVIK